MHGLCPINSIGEGILELCDSIYIALINSKYFNIIAILVTLNLN